MKRLGRYRPPVKRPGQRRNLKPKPARGRRLREQEDVNEDTDTHLVITVERPR